MFTQCIVDDVRAWPARTGRARVVERRRRGRSAPWLRYSAMRRGRTPSAPNLPSADGAEQGRASPLGDRRLSRRSLMASAARLGLAAPTLGFLGAAVEAPRRDHGGRGRRVRSDIQYDIAEFVLPARTVDGVHVRFPPIYTSFVTLSLTRTPNRSDRQTLREALTTIERRYAFSPSGLFLFIAYGLPYFERLPGGVRGALVSGHIPTLRADRRRLVLEEALPGPTDVSRVNPHVVKRRFNVPVRIETNDVLLILRSDALANIESALRFLTSDTRTLGGRAVRPAHLERLLRVTSRRLMFEQMGLPRRVAEHHGLPYAPMISPRSAMWMSFADQQVDASGPPAITSFAGSASARLTSAKPGDYFDNGSIVHLSHLIEDLDLFYTTEPYLERVQYMFRSNPIPSVGYADQFTDSGGPVFLPNRFHGRGDAIKNAGGVGTYEGQRRLGHLAALQRSSRAADTTPMHIRADGPGFDSMDVPDGSQQPKLQFAIFVPTADFFTTLRRNQASPDLTKRFGVPPAHNGIERFITATRRQNFLVPPRRHRSFPLVELVAG
jgi:hypothetical protein